MKKLSVFIVLIFLASMFNSCEDDPKDPSLIGKWLFESNIIEYYEDNVLVDTETNYSNPEMKYIEFFKDGTGFQWYNEIDYLTFTWTKDGDNGTYKYVGDTIEHAIKIEKLTEGGLIFTETEEEEDDGVVYRTSIKITMSSV